MFSLLSYRQLNDRSILSFFSEKKRKKIKNEKKKSLYPLSFTLYRSVIRVLRIMLKKKKNENELSVFVILKFDEYCDVLTTSPLLDAKGEEKNRFATLCEA